MRPENLNFKSRKLHLISCNSCQKYCSESIEKFKAEFDNYRRVHCNYDKNMEFKQESPHAHLANSIHSCEGDKEVRLIDQSNIKEDFSKRDSFWQHEFETFQENGLNECEVDFSKLVV